ncbi:hypothetical protein FRB97_002419, partial [Tulasnella sp. 331]
MADSYDKDVLDSLDKDLDTMLIFAGLFSSVNSTVLISSIAGITTNPLDETNALLRLIAHYGQVGVKKEQCLRRQEKFSGATRWYLRYVVESLPTLLQISLLAFFVGLIDFFQPMNKILTGVTTRLLRLCRALSFSKRFFTKKVLQQQQSSDDQSSPKETKLHLESVLWALEVGTKKNLLQEAARSIEIFTTAEACSDILKHPGYERLVSRLNTSLAGIKKKQSNESEAIMFGRALIQVLSVVQPRFQMRIDTWYALSQSWPRRTLESHNSELFLIANFIQPTLLDESKFELITPDFSELDASAAPLYIACLMKPGGRQEVAVLQRKVTLISELLKDPHRYVSLVNNRRELLRGILVLLNVKDARIQHVDVDILLALSQESRWDFYKL